jgi:hypothetical protein
MKTSPRVLVALSVALAAPAGVRAAAPAAGWTLHPDGFGTKSYAAWRAHEGEADDRGNADQALYFQKLVPTAVPAAGVAVFDVPEGTTVADITPLGFDYRVADSHCGAGAPRFNLQYRNAGDSTVYTAFIGCAAMVKTPDPQQPDWMHAETVIPGPAVYPLGPPPTAGSVVVGLAIVFDEGIDNPPNPGRAWLDDIQVGRSIWTSPADNGAQ